MSTTDKKTVDEYRAIPWLGWEGPRYQLVDGELVRMVTPPIRHQSVLGALFVRLHGHEGVRAAGEVVLGPLSVFLGPHDAFQPDGFFVANEHLARICEDGLEGAPDLVIEVISPETRALDLTKKHARYAIAGVVEAWYVDLDMDEILVYRLQENAAAPARTLRRGDTLMSALLPGFEIGADAVIDAT